MSVINYYVNIVETLSKVVEIEASTEQEALEKAELLFEEGHILMYTESDSAVNFSCQSNHTREEFLLKKIINETVINEHNLADWEATAEEIELICKLYEENFLALPNLIDNCFRIDSKTTRLISAGWVVYGGVEYFKNEQDVIFYLNNKGIKGNTIDEVINEVGEDNCYLTEWY